MSDNILRALTSAGEDFDVEQHASKILQSCNFVDVSKYVEELTLAEQDLDKNLEDHVSTHYQDLLSQATGVERLESHLSTVCSQAQSLSTTVQRTRSRVSEPYEKVRIQTITLERLQETCDLLRKIIRILQLIKKLRNQLQAGPSEIAKAAQSLSELTELWEPEEELSGIELIEQDQRILMQARVDVEKSADSMLFHGMDSKNHNQIAISLQVYFNLGVLQRKIDELVSKQVKDVGSKMSELFDVQRIVAVANESNKTNNATQASKSSSLPGRPNRAQGSTTLNTSAFRSILWSNLETVLDGIFSTCCEMMQLQKILCKKRDLVGNSFLELIEENKRQVVSNVWGQLVQLLKQNLSKGASSSSLMKETLEGEFPKMVRFVNDLWIRLCQSATTYLIADTTTSNGCQLINPFQDGNDSVRPALTSLLEDYERQYLSRSLSRLFDPINLMFSTTSRESISTTLSPDQDELRRVFRVVASELNIAQVDNRLLLAVAKNIAKTVNLMCNKSELMLVFEHEGGTYPAEDHRTNIATINCLNAFDSGIRNCVEDSALQEQPQGREMIFEALAKVDTLIRTGIDPLIKSIRDGVEAILLTMHNESWESDDQSHKNQKSPYMKELQTFVSRISIEFLGTIECKLTLEDHIHRLATKCVDSFITHVSLVRPVSTSGKGRLSQDCLSLETALEPLFNYGQIKTTDSCLERLASLRTLLATDAKDFPSCSELTQRKLPFSVILHLLFSSSPPEIKSPYESAGWTISRYIGWLEDHPSENDRLQLIQGALEQYVASTRSRKEKSYAFPYLILFELLQTAFKRED